MAVGSQGVPLSMDTVSDLARGATSWLKRLWPLLLLIAAGGLVFAMGWQRYLTLEQLAENRDTLRALIEGNFLLALAAFVALYAVSVALSLPGGAVLTIAGGFLFGWILKMGVWKLTGVAGPILGSAAGAALCFWLAHFVDRSIVSKR